MLSLFCSNFQEYTVPRKEVVGGRLILHRWVAIKRGGKLEVTPCHRVILLIMPWFLYLLYQHTTVKDQHFFQIFKDIKALPLKPLDPLDPLVLSMWVAFKTGSGAGSGFENPYSAVFLSHAYRPPCNWICKERWGNHSWRLSCTGSPLETS